MRPVLFYVDGVPIYAYGTFFLLSLLTVLGLVLYEARRRRWPKEEVVPILLSAFVGGMLGARLSILFFNGWETFPEVLNLAALFDVAWFGVLWALRDHPAMQNGNLLKFGLAGYALVRFFIEFVRNNRVIWIGLTGQQLLCLGLLAALAVWFAFRRPPLATA